MNSYYIIAYTFAIIGVVNFISFADTPMYIAFIPIAITFYLFGEDEKKKMRNDHGDKDEPQLNE